jgi:hypothetical protein
MEGLGHFEFGAALRPIAFGAEPPDSADAARPEFWLRYWADAYEAVLATAGPRTVLVDHDALSAEPRRLLPPLADALGLADPGALAAQAPRFRRSRPAEPPEAPRPLLARAAEIHAALLQRCLRPEPLREAVNAR